MLPMAAKNKAFAGIGGLALVLVASYFGFDLNKEAPKSQDAQPTATSKQAQPLKQAQPRKQAQPTSGLPTCAVATLPEQARLVIGDIKKGGPFQHPDNDGVHFGNFERKLPKNDYREYTVDTPGVNHRGPRRIVTGGGSERNPGTWFYTADHYESFCEIPDAD